MTAAIRILVVDDHNVVRQGISAMIKPKPDMQVIGEATDGLEGIEMARALSPDVILMDLIMPRMGGVEAIKGILKDDPEARILVLTSFADDENVLPAIMAGASGYILKVSSAQELIDAIRDVHQGGTPLHPDVARKLMDAMAQRPGPPIGQAELTERELEVLKLVARGMSNQAIADNLYISEGTVRTHVTRILDKLQLENRTQAALYAVREGLTPLYPEEE